MTVYNNEDIFTAESQDFKSTLRVDNELFNEDDSNVIHQVINVKRVKNSKHENWQILLNGKIAVLLKGKRLTNTEKECLRTVKGMKFLIEEYKNGTKSISKFKEGLKKVVET